MQCFDPAIPLMKPVDDLNIPIALVCACCGVEVANDDARTMHQAFHDHITAVSSSTYGVQANPAAVPGLGTLDVTVALVTPMTSTTYGATPSLITATATLLGTITIVGVVTMTKTNVVVRLRNSGVTPAAAGQVTVLVTAIGSAT